MPKRKQPDPPKPRRHLGIGYPDDEDDGPITLMHTLGSHIEHITLPPSAARQLAMMVLQELEQSQPPAEADRSRARQLALAVLADDPS